MGKLSRRQKFKDVGLMTVNDVVDNVYTAWLNDGSHWINKDKTGIFCNATDPKEQKLADEIASKILKGFNFNGTVVCRRKYNPRRIYTLRKVVVVDKGPDRCYYVN